MRILVNGAGGQLGSDFIRSVPRNGVEVIGKHKKEWNILDPRETRDCIQEIRPDICIHCAAYTKVDQSESIPDLAYEINDLGTQIVAEACQKWKVKMVFFSTDYVFAGDQAEGYKEDGMRKPINIYGKSKARGEEKVQEICDEWLILRTSWLYAKKGHNFVNTIRNKILQGDHLKVVNDQIGSPTFTEHVVDRTIQLLERGGKGIFHLSHQGKCSWYDLALAIGRAMNKDVEIQPISSEELSQAAKRPKYSQLIDTRLQEYQVEPMPPWEEGLEAYFRD
ncbi:dTDP-4-dehydrorhamnose reductase [Rossellomorea yichunensis]|uniref:dTDP-4-dehydrorhamnose reductase n=1 Tax=Rossellomorea yichunensis TaxID=3077331 RepID=UPI0028DDA361|nr:dTDP-4-dehydrorhamnose reductase [Rossellomorea sp. YC4-1]MDT9027893.1 dTDP-4-dehydrorhamnose reductase [Rossellomorea sp. YC4-1]